MINVIMFMGSPGSGKSTLAQSMAAEFNAEKRNSVVISSDAIRHELNGSEGSQLQPELIWSTFHERAINAIESCEYEFVVLDATFNNRFFRHNTMKRLRESHTPYAIHAIYCKPTLEVCLARNKGRDRNVPEEVILKMYRSLEKEPPTQTEGFLTVVTVED